MVYRYFFWLVPEEVSQFASSSTDASWVLFSPPTTPMVIVSDEVGLGSRSSFRIVITHFSRRLHLINYSQSALTRKLSDLNNGQISSDGENWSTRPYTIFHSDSHFLGRRSSVWHGEPDYLQVWSLINFISYNENFRSAVNYGFRKGVEIWGSGLKCASLCQIFLLNCPSSLGRIERYHDFSLLIGN